MILPYIAALFIAKRSALRSGLLAATIVSMSWMQVLTASRSGTLVVVFSVLLTSLLVARGSPRGRIVQWGTIFALVVTIFLAPAVFWERIATIADNDSAPVNTVGASADLSKQERYVLLMRSVTLTIEHPLFGLGLGNFDVVNGTELDKAEAWIGTHNTYTQISSEAGVPALFLLLALFYSVLQNMKQVMRMTMDDPRSTELNLLARASIVSLLSFFLGGFFAHKGYDYYAYTAPIAVAVGIYYIAAATQKTYALVSRSPASPQQHACPGWTL
jgi:O-antigen ligase